MSEATWLSPEDIAQLTGIRGGYKGETREQRQCKMLKKQKIPFVINAAGRPIVARAYFEGTKASQQPAAALAWEPGVAMHG